MAGSVFNDWRPPAPPRAPTGESMGTGDLNRLRKEWETNWIMDFTRVASSAGRSDEKNVTDP
jgi:hypothetical protein